MSTTNRSAAALRIVPMARAIVIPKNDNSIRACFDADSARQFIEMKAGKRVRARRERFVSVAFNAREGWGSSS